LGCAVEASSASGVIAIVPWERPQTGWTSRLWGTVQATTRGAEGFFRAMPDGKIGPALRFAILAEIFAVASTALVIAPLVVLAVPGLLLRFITHASTRESVALATLVAVIGFSTLLVGAHAIHGMSFGTRIARSRALRLGLYACGWDFGSSPAGFVVALMSGGVGSAFALAASSVGAPARAAEAALDGLFLLYGDEARRAKRRAVALAMLIAVPAVLVVLALVVVTALFAVPTR
ncbi:MAG TPA: hypothetical protein VGL13_17150, partial [Polyangiaceae bacterium]